MSQICFTYPRTRLEIHTSIVNLDYISCKLWLEEATPYQNFTYALKSKDVKRQYPAMLLRFLNFTNASGETIEEKCISLYDFSQKVENRKALESELMRYIHLQQSRVDNKEISPGTLRNYIKAVKHFPFIT